MMRTSNPILNDKNFSQDLAVPGMERMTVSGTANKTVFLLLLAVAAASYVWKGAMAPGGLVTVTPWILGGAIGGFITAMIVVFKKTWAPFLAPVYAILEGLCLGGVSAMYQLQYQGLVLQAVGLTFTTLFALLAAYRLGAIKATENFKLGVFAATGGIAILYLISFVLGFFHIQVPFMNGSGTFSILFSLFVVVIAALNLVLDFDFIENGAAQGLPKYMEWMGAFGLMVTLVWLYLEILRLLAKARNRN